MTDFTACEAMMLLAPGATPASRLLKTALTALVLRRVLRIDEETKSGMMRRTRRIPHLRANDSPEARLRPFESSIVSVVRASGGGTMPEVVKQARRAYGAQLLDFPVKHVRPGLIDRGLLSLESFKYLLFFKGTRPVLTPRGVAEKDGINARLDNARALPAVLGDDPLRAAAVAVGLGELILLLPELRPHYRGLSDAMRRRSEDETVNLGGGMALNTLAFADFDLGAFDAATFDSLDASMSAMDAGFDAASSSDGGGGDSGGSGG